MIEQESGAYQSARQRKILLYGDVNLDVMDGSAVWLVSLAQVLSKTASDIYVLLKTEPKTLTLLSPLEDIDGLHLYFPNRSGSDSKSQALTPKAAAERLRQIDEVIDADILIARGQAVSFEISNHPGLIRKFWSYITDLPYPITEAKSEELENLESLSSKCRRLFAQTEEARSYLESIAPSAAGKTLLLPPMVPDEFFSNLSAEKPPFKKSRDVSLVYAGKFAEDWRTLEMCALPTDRFGRHTGVSVSMIGSKFQKAMDPEWPEQMRNALKASSKVSWHGVLSRSETIKLVAEADYGLGWRAPLLDSSLELSTKALEYAAAGTPPIINRTAMHESIFGVDYPLFLEEDSPEEVLNVIGTVGDIGSIRRSAQNAVRSFSFTESANRLEGYFRRGEVTSKHFERARTFLIVGHDLKFAGELVETLETSGDFTVVYDEWDGLNSHDEVKSFERLQSADVVFCEWAGNNAVWYSQRVSADQKIFIRLHEFEAYADWLEDIAIENVENVFVVSEHLKRQVIRRTGWDENKMVVIPNALNIPDLTRPKFPGHQFRIGLVGMVPFLKRPDRAVDALEKLLEFDSRFTLHVRGRLPWEYSYVWRKAREQEAYLALFARIGSSSHLKQHVVFEPFGADMGSWLRKIGWVLSPSNRESFHLAPAEAMASKAVPIIWEREGARQIFSDQFVVNDSDAAANRILDLIKERGGYKRASDEAFEYVLRFDQQKVHSRLLDILTSSS